MNLSTCVIAAAALALCAPDVVAAQRTFVVSRSVTSRNGEVGLDVEDQR